MSTARLRIHSVILIPLLLALIGSEGASTTTDSTTGGRIELDFPAERRVPSPQVPKVPTTTPEDFLDPSQATATLEGRVIDARTREPVVHAEVAIPEVDRRAVTDRVGRFVIGNVPPRSEGYEVLVTCPGYQSLFTEAVFKAGVRVDFEFRLKPIGW